MSVTQWVTATNVLGVQVGHRITVQAQWQPVIKTVFAALRFYGRHELTYTARVHVLDVYVWSRAWYMALFLGVAFFAAKMAPKLAAVFGFIFLLGRVVFAQGYYSGIAEKKDNGAFGYMLGIFPLYGLAWLYLVTELKLLAL